MTVESRPPPVVARIEAGEAKLGCIGWSPTTNAVVCITGAHEWQRSDSRLETLGPTDMIPTDLDSTIDDATAARISGELTAAHFVGLPQDGVAMNTGEKIRVGGVVLQLDVVGTDSHQDNTAPTFETVITAQCNGQRVVLLSAHEEGRAYQASARALGPRVLVDVTSSLAREGEYGSGFEALLLDPTTCTFEATAGTPPP